MGRNEVVIQGSLRKITTTKTRKVRNFLREVAIEEEAVRARIRQARDEQGLTQANLADLMDVSKSTVEKWENSHLPPYRKIPRLAKVLNKTEDWILYGDEVVSPSEAAAIRDEMRGIRSELAEVRQLLAQLVRGEGRSARRGSRAT